MTPNIIAFTGFKQVGKSTAAQYLADQYGYVRHNFKDALVEELKERFPDLLEDILWHYQKEYEEIDGFTIYPYNIDWLFTTKPPLVRTLMQNYGTNVRRADEPDYWVKQWHTRTVSLQTKAYVSGSGYIGYPIVTDDVRFLNEAKAIKDAGGIIIRLTRPDITTGGDHLSETEQLDIEPDHIIEVAKGDQETLYRELDAILG